MTVYRQSVLVRWCLISSLLLLIIMITIDLVKYPAVVTTAGIEGFVYLILFVLAIFIYGWFALFRTRAATPAERVALQQGTLWGLLCGIVWVIELLVANIVSPHLGQLYLALYYGSALAGFLLPGLASLLAAWRARQITSGLSAGLLCGMFGGLAIFLASLVLSATLLKAGQIDPQTIREFQRSGLPDITTYIVADYLAGMITHLWIGLVTGFLLGALGGAIGKSLVIPEKVAS